MKMNALQVGGLAFGVVGIAATGASIVPPHNLEGLAIGLLMLLIAFSLIIQKPKETTK